MYRDQGISPKNFVIRSYRDCDFDACMALAPRLAEGIAPWRDTGRLEEVVKDWVAQSLEGLPSTYKAALVAEADSVIGLVTVAKAGHFSGQQDAYVGELAVAESHACHGVGRKLMGAAEDWARRQGLDRLTLHTGARNTAAREFYSAIGYEYEEVKLSRAL